MTASSTRTFFNPFFDASQEFDWLGLPRVPERDELTNPLRMWMNDYEDPASEFTQVFRNPNYLSAACKYILNIDILPFQALILEKFWTTRFPILIASRGAGKSFLLAVYSMLRLLLNPGCKVVLVGAVFRQSRQIYDYMVKIWDNAPVLRDIASAKGNGGALVAGPKRETDRYEFRLGGGTAIAIPLGHDGTKVRGLRANYVISDEVASINEEIFDIVIRGFAVSSFDPVNKIKKAAHVKKMKKMGLWNAEAEKMAHQKMEGNQIVYSGTAFYSFNHFSGLFDKWRKIVYSKGDPGKLKDVFEDGNVPEGFNWKDYCVLRIPYNKVPEGLLDREIIAQAKAKISRSHFLMEYGAVFVSDSDGFYKRSIIESCTTNKAVTTANGERVQFVPIKEGDPERHYVMAIDPAADKDNAAIVILEDHISHRRIVHCWSTNKKKFKDLKKYYSGKGIEFEDDYYVFVARKIKNLMAKFNISHIMMDKHGGGLAISEALCSKKNCNPGELPIFLVPDPDDPQPEDMEEGLHILELVKPTSDLNSESNHGMLKDFQDKVLLFPKFDVVEIEKARQLDELNNIIFDTFEDLVIEIEELKTEICTVECRPSSTLGKEVFDTPEVKGANNKKGRLKKDRYSALLYANWYLRNREKNKPIEIKYTPIGGSSRYKTSTTSKEQRGEQPMYHGPGMIGVENGQDWMTGNIFRGIRR